MDNIFVAATNLYSLRAIYVALKRKKYVAAIILGSATIGSIVYHLSETKHNMNSLCLKNHTTITLNIDRFFAVCSSGYLVWMFKKNINKKVILIGSLGLVAMMLSECQHVLTLPPMVEKNLYLCTHPLWHICAFHVAYLLVR